MGRCHAGQSIRQTAYLTLQIRIQTTATCSTFQCNPLPSRNSIFMERKFCYFKEDLWEELLDDMPDRQISHHVFSHGYLAVHLSGQSLPMLNDARMNRLAALDSTGTKVQEFAYDPFGVELTPPSLLESVFVLRVPVAPCHAI